MTMIAYKGRRHKEPKNERGAQHKLYEDEFALRLVNQQMKFTRYFCLLTGQFKKKVTVWEG